MSEDKGLERSGSLRRVASIIRSGSLKRVGSNRQQPYRQLSEKQIDNDPAMKDSTVITEKDLEKLVCVCSVVYAVL